MCQALATPILADQSIFDIKDVIAVIENGAADVIMVKNYVVGGFYRTKQVLGILEATHTANYIEGGTETGIGTAATLHLAASTAQVDYWGCVNGPFHLSNDMIKEPLQFDNGCWRVPTKPGLGVELDEEKLKMALIEKI
jgi:muconate cycloisomerase